MEVIAGPTFSIEVSAPSYIRERPPDDKASPRCLFLSGADEEEEGGGAEKGVGFRSSGKSLEESSESSSSIGAPDDSDDEEEEDDAVSSKADGGMASLIALDDVLPVKRGLSNHFSGKSKSFANLSEVSTVMELEKGENPINKRRRVLMANKWYMKKASFYSWQNPKSMPLLALNEEDDDDDGVDRLPQLLPSPSSSSSSSEKVSCLKSRMKSQSCFSLADLQEEDKL